MKPLLFCTAALALAASVGAVALQSVPSSSVTANSAPSATTRVDEPPPEPIDCPFCGGDGTLHVRRMRVIERQAFAAMLLVLPR